MPLPFLLWGAAAVVGAVGVGAGLSGKSDLEYAQSIVENIKTEYDELEADYKLKIDELNSVLEELGRTRLIANERIQKISESISKIGTVSKKQYNNFIESINYTKEEVEQMSFSSRKSSEILQTGIKSLSSGALAGFGAMGLIGNIGVASTGAAISGLSGVAATNATLAWLGGGTLAAGGFGIAGGSVALGGIFLAPVALIGGFSLASKGKKAITEAEKYEAEVKIAIEHLNSKIDFLQLAKKIANDYIEVISVLDSKANLTYQKLEKVIDFYVDKNLQHSKNRPLWKKIFGLGKIDYLSTDNWEEEDLRIILVGTAFAKHMNQLCNIQIIDAEVVKEDSVKLLEHVSKNHGITLEVSAKDS